MRIEKPVVKSNLPEWRIKYIMKKVIIEREVDEIIKLLQQHQETPDLGSLRRAKRLLKVVINREETL